MPKLNTKRLTILRDYLKTIPKDSYNQYQFAKWGWQKNEPFVGCGFGHATQIPAFKKAGYKLVCGQPSYKDNEDTGSTPSIAKFFGLDYGLAEWLSIGDYRINNTPTQMINRLTALLEGRLEKLSGVGSSYKIRKAPKVST